MNRKQINLSFLNCKNFKSNIIYSEYLVSHSNITYFNELWLKQNECTLLDSISKNKKILFKSDMDCNYNKGRPYGGQAFIIDDNLNVIESDFLNRYLSYIFLDIHGLKTLFIGVYMPFDDSKHESKCLYEITLSYISALITKFKHDEIPIFLIGDFNADFFRKNRFDKILSEFTSDHNLLPLDHQCTQYFEYTFATELKDKLYHFNLDHAMILEGMESKISDIQ